MLLCLLFNPCLSWPVVDNQIEVFIMGSVIALMLFVWVLPSALVGVWAERRQRSGMWAFVLCVLISWPLVFFLYFILGNGRVGTKECEHCKSRIYKGATICKFCRSDIKIKVIDKKY